MNYDFNSMVNVVRPLYRSAGGAVGQDPRESGTQYKIRLQAMQAEKQRQAGGGKAAPRTKGASMHRRRRHGHAARPAVHARASLALFFTAIGLRSPVSLGSPN